MPADLRQGNIGLKIFAVQRDVATNPRNIYRAQVAIGGHVARQVADSEIAMLNGDSGIAGYVFYIEIAMLAVNAQVALSAGNFDVAVAAGEV